MIHVDQLQESIEESRDDLQVVSLLTGEITGGQDTVCVLLYDCVWTPVSCPQWPVSAMTLTSVAILTLSEPAAVGARGHCTTVHWHCTILWDKAADTLSGLSIVSQPRTLAAHLCYKLLQTSHNYLMKRALILRLKRKTDNFHTIFTFSIFWICGN